MIFTLVSNFLIIISILGYSYLLKKFLFVKENYYLVLIDIVFGFIFLLFISIFFNFFLALEKLTLITFIIGIIIFIYCISKKLVKINFWKLILILSFFSFIFYDNGNNVDSAVYHIQSIKWSNLYKTPIGLSNLDWLYPLNSSWHTLLSLFSFQIKEFNTIYILNIIPLSIIYYEIFNNKENIKKLSYVTLYLSGIYLIIFSVIHPFKNGVIFNHYGNPEVDSIGMCFFILSSYLFLKYFEENNKYNFNLLLITSFLCVTSKITYSSVVLFPIYILIYEKFYYLKSKIIFLASILSALWMIRSFLYSACFIYPINFTCLNTQWFFGEEKITQLVNLTKGFSRDTRLRDRYTDFDHVIYSYDWFIPWFNDYFLNTKMLLISTFIIILSIFLTIFSYFLNNKTKISKPFYFIIFSFVISMFIWFQAPEIRFGWGILIVFPCLFLAMSILNFSKLEIFYNKNIFMICILAFFSLSILKNFDDLTYRNLVIPYEKKWDYSQITSIGKFNGEEIFLSYNWQCADFSGICVNKKKENYYVYKKYNYLIFLNDKSE